MLCAAAGNTVMALKWLVLGVMLAMSAVQTGGVSQEAANDTSFSSSDYVLTYAVVVSALLVAVIITGAVRRLRRKLAASDQRDISLMDVVSKDPLYDEINEVGPRAGCKSNLLHSVMRGLGLFPHDLPPPAVPGRRPNVNEGRVKAKKKIALLSSEEPEYIIPDAPDNVDPDGYLRPLGETRFGIGYKK